MHTGMADASTKSVCSHPPVLPLALHQHTPKIKTAETLGEALRLTDHVRKVM
jgi:hypothetical protein